MLGHDQPLLRFVFLGGVLFLADSLRTERGEVRVDAASVAAAVEQFEDQQGRAPTPDERSALAEALLREEVLLAEARRLGLDQDDLVVRRRLIQKMRFLLAEEPAAPSDAELEAWLQSKPERYSRPAQLSFEHRFYSSRGRGAPQEDAEAALRGDPSQPADPFPLGLEVTARAQDKVAQELGDDIAEALAQAQPGEWFGPLPSAYGWHLLRLDSRTPGGLPPIEEVRGRLTEDWLEAAREAQLEEAIEELVDRTPAELRAP